MSFLCLIEPALKCLRQFIPIALALSATFYQPLTIAQQAQRQPDFISVQITTQQWEDGKPDKSRMFIFYFSYLGKGAMGPGYCDVVSITVNNLGCDKNSIGEGGGFWLKPEYANADYKGRDGFTCKFAKTGEKDADLTVTETDPLMTFTHRIKLTKDRLDSYAIADYRGSLVKSSTITNRIESVEYKALQSKSETGWNAGWENTSLGCNRMTVPVINRSLRSSRSK